jgi:CRISPR-associated protein Csd1
MNLEQNRTTRDYLYGRLLAIADSIESYSLSLTDEGKKRDTTAARFMQRFAARPYSTWINIELALGPYATRLKAGSDKSSAFLAKRRRLLDEVIAMMDKIGERTSDKPLSGEFLLGFHAQRQQFQAGGKTHASDVSDQAVPESTSEL